MCTGKKPFLGFLISALIHLLLIGKIARKTFSFKMKKKKKKDRKLQTRLITEQLSGNKLAKFHVN